LFNNKKKDSAINRKIEETRLSFWEEGGKKILSKWQLQKSHSEGQNK